MDGMLRRDPDMTRRYPRVGQDHAEGWLWPAEMPVSLPSDKHLGTRIKVSAARLAPVRESWPRWIRCQSFMQPLCVPKTLSELMT
jgi:hypothetical protein